MKIHTLLLSLSLPFLAAGTASAAAVSAISFTAPGSLDHTQDDLTGYRFTVGAADIIVTSLGFWDEDGDGLTDPHDVAIYSVSTEFFETMTTIPSGSATELISGFRFEPVDPVTLFSGESYIILAYRPTDADGVTYLPEGPAIASYITLESDIAANAAGHLRFADTTFSLPEGGWYGPNFQAEIAGVPEPTTPLLLGLTTAGLLRRRRRR